MQYRLQLPSRTSRELAKERSEARRHRYTRVKFVDIGDVSHVIGESATTVMNC